MNLLSGKTQRLGIGALRVLIVLTIATAACVGLFLSQTVRDASGTPQDQTIRPSPNRTIPALIGIGVVATGIGAVISIIRVRELVRRIRDIRRATDELARGNLGFRLNSSHRDEVGKLACGVDRLARRFEAVDSQLRTARDELKAGVEARTAEIAAANEELEEEIAERIHAENALLEEKNLLRSLVDIMESMDVGLTIQDTGYNITYQNSFMKRFGGLGKKCYETYEKSPKVCAGCPVQKAFADGQPHRTERTTPAPGGGVLYWDNTAHPIRNAAGEITSCFEVVRNITEQKNMEHERERVIERQGQLNRLQQILLGPGELGTKLRMITDRIVDIFDADFARIWLVRPGDRCYSGCVHAESTDAFHACRDRTRCLWLMAGSGRFKGTDSRKRGRVPFGCYEVGRLAEGDETKLIANEIGADLRIDNHAWAQELGLTSFAAYRLHPPGGETIGILALFSKHPISEEEDALLESIASTAAQVVLKAKAEEELEAAHRRHREASRLAGMAEVATGVLHNVGNVLTSANVTVELLRDKVRDSKVPSLAKAVRLMREHAGDLGTFMTTDEKGSQLPAFLNQLAEFLHKEQAGILEELNALTSNMEHIKTIVAAQQEHATLSVGVTESFAVSEVLEQALHLSETSLSNNRIKLVRIYDLVPDVTGDRHKLLQILINLTRNANAALLESPIADKRLAVRIAMSGDDRLSIDVEDNGIGIPAENMTRIFAQGFTARRDGHGFGLHYSALIARELGGVLTAHSDGPGKGARFTLDIPLCQASPADPSTPNRAAPSVPPCELGTDASTP